MSLKLLIMVCVLSVGGATDDKLAKPSVTMIGCSGGQQESPCVLNAGEVATIVTEFSMPNTTRITSLRLEVDYETDEVPSPAPYGIDENLANACNHLVGKQCPLVAGDKVRHILNLPIRPFAKQGRIILKFLDDDKKSVSYHEEWVKLGG